MKVLFVEDDAMNRRVVRDMLQVAGLEMAEAENAELGLSMIEDNAYELILMDLRMPGMDGLEAIQKIRARTDSKGKIPIIVVTADTAPKLKGECAAIGADAFLQKPVAMNALFEAIGRIIAEKGEAISI